MNFQIMPIVGFASLVHSAIFERDQRGAFFVVATRVATTKSKT